MQVFVRDNNVDQALRALKKKMQREGIFREMKRRKAYEKPSERKTREKAEAIRRARKAARKQAQREGLIPPPQTPGGRAPSVRTAEVVLSFLAKYRREARRTRKSQCSGRAFAPGEKQVTDRTVYLRKQTVG